MTLRVTDNARCPGGGIFLAMLNFGCMPQLKSIIERTDTKAGFAFAVFIQLLILISVTTFSIETLPHLNPVTLKWLNRVDFVILVLFTIEYLARFVVADHPWQYIRSFYGIIDLVAIFPFWIGNVIDLRAVRVFRFLRLFRVLKIVRYNKAIRRLFRALHIAREEIVLFTCVTGILMYLAAVGIYYCEHEAQPEKFASVFHSLWWAVATLTTVGYGDVYPITVGGRCFTFFILIIGLAVVSVPAGLVAASLQKAREMEEAEKGYK
ncbi:ion transporter [Bythopirellula polymerisocia]|uniref:Cyclic nucleotide-gated potassium channel n=1 Tax=Bythopirellula polymerisocia TaxID=2528003 RepID=A0A5C6CFZ0_9BACT|nr:ion transporter [Bythopirellula polymerisocia]TWU22627.1 Cyclic nucleotide-gated potassium channel [Bythopirellula polymerisocia]